MKFLQIRFYGRALIFFKDLAKGIDKMEGLVYEYQGSAWARLRVK